MDLHQLLRVRSAYAGRFDADGHLAFIADLSGVPQVWTTAQRGGWPELRVAPPDRAQTIYAGPRPGQLVVGADVGGNEHTQLLYVDVPGAEWQALTDNAQGIHTFGSFSPDGASISYGANTRTGRWFDVYVRDLASGDTRCVLEHDSTNHPVAFSPDGAWLIVLRAWSNSRHELWLIDPRGAHPPRLLTDAQEEAVYEDAEWSPDGRFIYCVSDRGRELSAPARIDVSTGELTFLFDPELDVDEAHLDASGTRLAYARNRDGEAEVVIRTLATGVEVRVEGLPPGALYTYWQSALAWDRDGQQLAISWTASRASPNVFVWSAASSQTKQVTFAGDLDAQLAELTEPEHVQYPSFDGRDIPALFYPTPGGGSSNAPCVVFVHGGPEGQYRPTFQPIVQYLVSAGFAVLAPNVRGSSGYGRTYVHLDDVRKRMDSVADLAHAVYWLRDTGRADPHRIAVYGGSYGGFMVLSALTTYPDLWAAGVDLVGISNFVTFLENTGPWRRHLREAEYGSLENDRDFLEEISPINNVDRIRAPLLVIHGANDPRVPISETEQMVAQLRALERTVEFLRLDDEGHQIAKLKNKLTSYPRAVEFLRLHLGTPIVV
jgi:dipeptidyl aminopeptidase/acylaminoacyl peptidase